MLLKFHIYALINLWHIAQRIRCFSLLRLGADFRRADVLRLVVARLRVLLVVFLGAFCILDRPVLRLGVRILRGRDKLAHIAQSIGFFRRTVLRFFSAFRDRDGFRARDAFRIRNVFRAVFRVRAFTDDDRFGLLFRAGEIIDGDFRLLALISDFNSLLSSISGCLVSIFFFFLRKV